MDNIVARLRVAHRFDVSDDIAVEAADTIDELLKHIADLERDGPQMERGTQNGKVVMGTMRECLQDALVAVDTEARLADFVVAELDSVRGELAALRESIGGA